MSKKIAIELAVLMRMIKPVVVEVPDDFDTSDENKLAELMSDVYEVDDGDGPLEPDDHWGVDEGTHSFIDVVGSDKKSDFILTDRGVVVNEEDCQSCLGLGYMVDADDCEDNTCKICKGSGLK